MDEIRLKKIDKRAVIPTKAHKTDVGYDVTAIDCEYDVDKDMYIYHTGLACETTYHEGKVNVCNLYPRSSNCKTDAYLTNSVAVIDSDGYRGEIQARFKNRTSLETMIQLEALRQFSCGLDNSYSATEKMVRLDFINRAKNLEFAPYKVGDRIVQMVVYAIPEFSVKEVDEIDMNTERGKGCYGSSGN